MPGVSSGVGQGSGGTVEVPALTIACHEGRPPADDIFAYPGGRGDRILREVATSEAQGKLSAFGELVFDSRRDVQFKGLT
jgi:hypothetical protein